jgi:hypothetical protein
MMAAFLPIQTFSASQAEKPKTDGLARLTTVELIARGPDGAPFPFSKASLYLDTWGIGELVALPVNHESTTLHFDQAWLCSAWDFLCQNHQDGPARLILQSDGFAPVTASVYWPGQERPVETGLVANTAGIHFSGSRDIHITEGATQQIDVTFRRAVPRTLRIVDESGIAAADIGLLAWLFYGATNHTGTSEGELLARGKTDSDGRFPVPDIEGELAVELQPGPYVLRNPDPVNSLRAILVSDGMADAVTTLILYRFQRQTLRLNVIRTNGSAAGLTLGICLSPCIGACCGDLAVTDAQGQLRFDYFYPEETDSLYLTDNAGTVLWRGTPANLKNSTAIPTITIP